MKTSKEENKYHAINCRVPKETHERLQIICCCTKRNLAQTIASAIELYCNHVTGKSEATTELKIDQYAYSLTSKK